VNFLAHFALAHPEEPLMVGGFLGDFVKGILVGKWPREIETGIRLHRSIDAFTQTEPTIRESRQYFHPDIRRFVPIIVDIIGDHFLARRFEHHIGERLDAFAARVYDMLEEHRQCMPPDAERYRQRMAERDSLRRYRERDSLTLAFEYIARRFRREDLSEHALGGLTAHYEDLETDFEVYYPNLVEHARTWQCKNARPPIGEAT
jgi:acyl carrier protein phosphodiesterase